MRAVARAGDYEVTAIELRPGKGADQPRKVLPDIVSPYVENVRSVYPHLTEGGGGYFRITAGSTVKDGIHSVWNDDDCRWISLGEAFEDP
jgi:hypothetical protein